MSKVTRLSSPTLPLVRPQRREVEMVRTRGIRGAGRDDPGHAVGAGGGDQAVGADRPGVGVPTVAPQDVVEGILGSQPEIVLLVAARFGPTPHAGQGPVRGGVRPVQGDEPLGQGAQGRRLREVHEVVINPDHVFRVDRAGDLGIDALPGTADEVALEIVAPPGGVLGQGSGHRPEPGPGHSRAHPSGPRHTGDTRPSAWRHGSRCRDRPTPCPAPR